MANILLIGDDDFLADTSRITVMKAGHRVTAAGDGAESLAACFKGHHVDIPRGAEKIGGAGASRTSVVNDHLLSPVGRRRVASG
jgi:CheY-like chemotaxis protein